jgi:hypothetical protein
MPTKFEQKSTFLTYEEIQEFKKITKEVKGIELTDEEAVENGTRLIMLVELLAKTPFDINDTIETVQTEEDNVHE